MELSHRKRLIYIQHTVHRARGQLFLFFGSHLHIHGIIILNGWYNALDKLQEDEEVLVHGGGGAALLQGLDDAEHRWGVLARMHRG